ncbi:MAG: class I SAM-dependent methyltransferase [Acidobacteria bacterium]|nr:class I SAM-dependent methyltransferase [Acidobacteriota bacterium]
MTATDQSGALSGGDSAEKRREHEGCGGCCTEAGASDRIALAASYNGVAEEYAGRYFEELAHKPFDRLLLERFADAVRGRGPVCDLGRGPGQIARFLRTLGLDVIGVDLSPGMIALARKLNPDIFFSQGDMFCLDVADDSWGGIAAFYSIIHVPRRQVIRVLAELRRVLRSSGQLVLSFHLGHDDMHLDELWGMSVSMDFSFFERSEMEQYLRAAGFELLESHERLPYEAVEYQSRRGYIVAVRR